MTPADRGTRAAYDVVAASYARLLPGTDAEAPLDLAVLAAFAERARGGVVADVGCGTGRVAAHLAAAGLQVVGLDLSPGMLAQARADRPWLATAVAHAGALPVRTGALAGLMAWYSLIHLPPDALPQVLAECARAVRPGGPLVVAFQSGDGEQAERTTAYGHAVRLTSVGHRVEDVAGAVTGAGFALQAVLRREAWQAHESAPQAFLLAERR